MDVTIFKLHNTAGRMEFDASADLFIWITFMPHWEVMTKALN